MGTSVAVMLYNDLFHCKKCRGDFQFIFGELESIIINKKASYPFTNEPWQFQENESIVSDS